VHAEAHDDDDEGRVVQALREEVADGLALLRRARPARHGGGESGGATGGVKADARVEGQRLLRRR